MTFKIKMECEKWPKTKAGTLSLEVITSEERQQNPTLVGQCLQRRVQGGFQWGLLFFFFLSLAT